LSVHLPEDFPPFFKNVVGGEWRPSVPRWGYRYSWEHVDTGAILMAVQPHSDAKPIVVLSGSACDAMTEHVGFKDTFDMLRWLYVMATDCTRLDLAIDIHDGASSGYAVNELAQDEKIKARTKKVVTFQSQAEEYNVTTYFGARTSPRFLRVYTKTLSDDMQTRVTRVEQELKKAAADEAFGLLATGLRASIQTYVVSLLGRIVTQWNVEILDHLGLMAIDIPAPKRPDTSTPKKEWLSRQVIPSLKRDYKDEGWRKSLLRWMLREVRS